MYGLISWTKICDRHKFVVFDPRFQAQMVKVCPRECSHRLSICPCEIQHGSRCCTSTFLTGIGGSSKVNSIEVGEQCYSSVINSTYNTLSYHFQKCFLYVFNSSSFPSKHIFILSITLVSSPLDVLISCVKKAEKLAQE